MPKFENKFDRLLKPGWDSFKSQRSSVTKTEMLLKSEAWTYVTLSLSEPGIEQKVSRFLAEQFNHNTDVYDRALDSVYNQTHIGGAQLHHNLDGAHYWEGGFQVLRENFPDDSHFRIALEQTEHYFNDLTTPSGINPFLSPSDFQAQKDFLVETFNVNPAYANDLLNINLVEMCAAVTGTIAVAANLSTQDAKRLGESVSRLGISSLFAANPALFFAAAIVTGKALVSLWLGDEPNELLTGMTKGAFSGTAFFYAAAALPVSPFFALIGGLASAVAVNFSFDYISRIFQRDIDEVMKSSFRQYKPVC